MKKLFAALIVVSLFLCSVVVANADRSIGYYDYYTGLQSGMKIYATARPKVTTNMAQTVFIVMPIAMGCSAA